MAYQGSAFVIELAYATSAQQTNTLFMGNISSDKSSRTAEFEECVKVIPYYKLHLHPLHACCGYSKQDIRLSVSPLCQSNWVAIDNLSLKMTRCTFLRGGQKWWPCLAYTSFRARFAKGK